jgi:ubiquinone biosynthesis O-methyltransferase
MKNRSMKRSALSSALSSASSSPSGTLAAAAHSLAQQRAYSSVSTEEVEKFGNMSRDWWDPSKNPLIGMNTVRMQFIRETVTRFNALQNNTPSSSSSSSSQAKPFEGLRFLDMGCGGGLVTESLARLGADHVTGLDPSAELLERAAMHRDETLPAEAATRIEYVASSAEDFAAKALEPFDAVCLLDVIEHTDRPASLLAAADRLCKDDGLLFVSSINQTVKSFVGTIVAAEYLAGVIPVGTHDWRQFLSPEVVQEISNGRWKLADCAGMVVSLPSLLACNVTNPAAWQWRLDSTDTDMNWIGVYYKKRSEGKKAEP